MKSFLILAIFCILGNALAGEMEDEFDEAEEYCLKENEISIDDVSGILDLEKPTENMKIFAGCFLDKLGFVKDGHMQPEVILEKSKDSLYPKYFKNCVRVCRHIEGTDQNDVAYKTILCCRKVEKVKFLKEWKTISQDCKKEQQLSDEEYTKLQSLPAENPTTNMKQYTSCVFEKEAFLKDNVLQENVILEVAEDYEDAEYLKTFVEKCKQIKEDNQNDTAFKLFECLQKIKATHVE